MQPPGQCSQVREDTINIFLVFLFYLFVFVFVFVFNIVTGLNVSELNQMYEILG